MDMTATEHYSTWPIPTANMHYYYYAFVIVMIKSTKFALNLKHNAFNLNK